MGSTVGRIHQFGLFFLLAACQWNAAGWSTAGWPANAKLQLLHRHSSISRSHRSSGKGPKKDTKIYVRKIASNQALGTFSGLEKSAAIRPFATKKSRLASEKILLSGQFGDWKLPCYSGIRQKCDFFEQLFCFYQLVLVVWNTFEARFKLSFLSWVKQIWHFCGNGGKNCPSPIWGDFWGKRGSGKNHFSGRSGSVRLRDSPLSTRSPYHLYSFSGVRHVCHDNDGRFVHVYGAPVSQVTSIKACWAHFSLPFERLIFLDKHISVQQTLMINS